ncbi:hypothetical protein [Nocardioides pakistanensis]
MRFRSRCRPEPQSSPRFAFCEQVWATPTSPWHIRAVGTDGLRPGGGIVGESLCCRELTGGWDIPTRIVDEATLERLLTPDSDGRLAVCVACFAAWRSTQQPWPEQHDGLSPRDFT